MEKLRKFTFPLAFFTFLCYTCLANVVNVGFLEWPTLRKKLSRGSQDHGSFFEKMLCCNLGLLC